MPKKRVKKAKGIVKPKSKPKHVARGGSVAKKKKSNDVVTHSPGFDVKPKSLEIVQQKPIDTGSLIRDFSSWQDRRFGSRVKESFLGREMNQDLSIKKNQREFDFDLNIGALKSIPDNLRFAIAFGVFFLLGLLVLGVIVPAAFLLNGPSGHDDSVKRVTPGDPSKIRNISVLFKETIPSTILASSTSSLVKTTTTSTTSTTLFVCNRPYIIVGSQCCLDRDGNSICDRDEEAATTTTLGDYVRCSHDVDCGETRVQYKCVENVAHRLTMTHFCRNPEMLSSNCETKLVDDVLEICPDTKMCVERENDASCKSKYASNNFLD